MLQPQTFYMYRAQSDANYAAENVNMADLPGLMWYLHNEVVTGVPRHYDITRILRFRATVLNTPLFLSEWRPHMLAPFAAFDYGQCTAFDCVSFLAHYGAVVGCQPQNPLLSAYKPLSGSVPFCDAQPSASVPSFCNTGTWYSVPGPCPEKRVADKDGSCKAATPGGACPSSAVTGARDCTFHMEPAGEVRLDELVGLHNYSQWAFSLTQDRGVLPSGNVEYVRDTDSGVGTCFWDGLHDPQKCKRRMQAVLKLFEARYPELPTDLPQPPCM